MEEINRGKNSKAKDRDVLILKSDNYKLLEDIIEMEKDGKIKGLIISGMLNDGKIFTGYSNTNVIEIHTLISYLQTQVIRKQILNNLTGEEDDQY